MLINWIWQLILKVGIFPCLFVTRTCVACTWADGVRRLGPRPSTASSWVGASAPPTPSGASFIAAKATGPLVSVINILGFRSIGQFRVCAWVKHRKAVWREAIFQHMTLKCVKEKLRVGSFILTISRVLTVGGPAPSAAAPIGARGVEWVVAVVRQVAFLPLRARAPGSTRRSPVPYSDLTELLIDLETLHAQLLYLLQGRDRVNSVVHTVRFIACSSAHEMFQT